eukprot:gene18287-23967_t
MFKNKFLRKSRGPSEGTIELDIRVYPPSLDFLVAFLACVQVGIIAVPTFPPDPNRLNKDLNMFASISQSSGAKVALTSTIYSFATKVAGLKNVFSTSSDGLTWPELTWIVTDTIPSISNPIELPKLTHDSIAFLQYTSGSTSEPKGVIISHGNLAHNLKLIVTGLQAIEDTVVVSWLPQYHDMGLIGSYLGIIYCGGSAISQYKATHMQAPNFAYTLTARKFLALQKSINSSSYMRNKYNWIERLDLSSVRHMINAAEPVEASAIDNFYAVFGKYGLKEVIFPTYGLAEHTVYVCSNGKLRLTINKEKLELSRVVELVESGSDKSIVVVGCGKPSLSDSLSLKIVDSITGTVLLEKQVGEIWLKSKSRAFGYWGLTDKSEEDFNAKLGQDMGEASVPGLGESGFLRTGDLGFIYEGELFVTGRVKDLIIIRGRNHYPQDIERTCETKTLTLDQSIYPTVRGGCSAAFSIPIAGQEVLVYAAELSNTVTNQKVLVELTDSLRQTIIQVHSIEPSVICLLEPRTIFKTTSGKIARQWVRKAYLTDNLKTVYVYNGLDKAIDDGLDGNILPSKSQDKPTDTNDSSVDQPIDPEGKPINEIIDILKESVASCINIPVSSVNPSLPLARQGMDSMLGVQLQSILESRFSVPIPEELMFEADCTLYTLANALVTGGVVKLRPRLIDANLVVNAAIDRIKTNKSKTLPKGALSPEWFRKSEIKGDVDTQLFPEKYCLKQKDVTNGELTIALVFLSIVYVIPYYSWPPLFRTSKLLAIASKYFSYRVIYEVKIDITQPTIYSFGPFGLLPTSLTGCKVDNDTNRTAILKSGRSIGIISGGIKESLLTDNINDTIDVKQLKSTIKLALQSGAQLIPVYCLGISSLYEQSPLTTIFGRPIQCPLVQSPSPELINEYQEIYLREIRRLYEKFKNTHGSENKQLVFKR